LLEEFMKAVRFYEHGGPEVLRYEEVETPKPKSGEVLIKVEAMGVNYTDIRLRRNYNHLQIPLPCIPGKEISGTVVALGEQATGIKVGAKIAALVRGGGYAEYVTLPPYMLIPASGLAAPEAASFLLQGLTAYHTLKTFGNLKAEDKVLVHSGAGGVGTLAIQLARALGAGKVLATAGSPEKLALALSLGADAAFDYTQEGWATKVVDFLGGKGVNLILDGVGGKVFSENFKCLTPLGRVVVYGTSSNELTTINHSQLMPLCQTVTGFDLNFVANSGKMVAVGSLELLNQIGAGRLKLLVNHTLPLSEAAEAHRLLENRLTTGKVVLLN